jgi:outer membrane biosynthesis protein TonB
VEALSARLSLVESKLKALEQNGVPAAAPVSIPAKEPAPAPEQAPAEAPPWDEDYLPEPPPEEGYLPPEAYEPAPAPQPKPEPKPEPQPQPKPPAQPQAQPEPKPAAQPADQTAADALWKQVLARVQKTNAFVRQLAAYGQATALTEDQLTVTFPAEYAGKLKMLNARSVAVIQGELDAIRPGIRLLLREGDVGSDVADLVGLFKDKLTIT